MIVIANQAERRFLEDLDQCVRTAPVRKCFYLKFSKSQIQKSVLFESFLKALDALPHSYMAQVYLCRDKDIFILMQGFMQRQFVEFIEKLSFALSARELMDMINIFEVGVHAQELKNICQDKIVSMDNREIKDHQEETQKHDDQNKMKIFETLDVTRLNSIGERRKARKDINILVVDDDHLLRTLVGNVLRKDFRVEYGKNGAEALREYINCAPDIMFLDIGLPDINGHEVLEYVFQFDPEAYVIMFSGRKDQENMMRALKTGARGFVGKPFTREKLFEYIQQSPFITGDKRIPEQSKYYVK